MSLVLHDVSLGLTGRRATVHIEGDRVTAIEPVGRTGDLDAKGGTLLPGLRDAHAHLLQWASTRRRISLTDATSADAAAALLADAAPPGTDLVQGANFHAALWPDSPHKTLLDRYLPDRPAALSSNDLHALWLNSAALRMVGRDHPTGLFVEDECMALTADLPAPPPQVTDHWVLDATDAAAARGITAIADYEYADTIADWTRRARLRPPSTRIVCVIARFALGKAIAEGHRTGARLDDLLTVGPLKLFLDGSLNTRTAYCHHPYPDTDYLGELLLPPAALLPIMREAARNGITPALHAIGDQANTIALDAFATLGIRGRIEHAQLLTPADVPRFAELGVTAGIQPAHAPDDRDAAERHWPDRTTRAYAFGSLLAAGAHLELGSDAPVSTLDPWEAVASATTRTDDDRPPWHPEQALSLEAALKASTHNGKTTVEVGDRADLVLTAHDLATLPHGDLRDVEVTATILDGRPTHRTA